jgi:hypothetical protein
VAEHIFQFSASFSSFRYTTFFPLSLQSIWDKDTLDGFPPSMCKGDDGLAFSGSAFGGSFFFFSSFSFFFLGGGGLGCPDKVALIQVLRFNWLE